jgi:phenylpropionate dioxygenase-like ring-hydroxylating dioxygenase large terminal subunit
MKVSKTGRYGMPGTEIYWDPVIYEREMEVVFGSAWLFVGAESALREPGDFLSAYMGNDPVIVVRDRDGTLRVFLNRCRHRGNKVCLYDGGTAKAFRCAYHGWTYALDGTLTGLPLLDKAYDDTFDRDRLGLVAARVETFHGLIFATWNEHGPSLRDFFGEDLCWYLETFMFDDPDGLEVLPGRHRYAVPANWKLLAENFGGDMYHFPSTHASVLMAGRTLSANTGTAANTTDEYFSLEFTGTNQPPHGVLQFAFGPGTLENDRRQAELISPAAVAWVRERHARRARLVKDRTRKPTGIHTGNLWPNLSFNGFGTAFYARTFIAWQPRGPELTDAWQWAFVERSAPPEVKATMSAILSQRQAAAGIVAPDDVDNFQRMKDVLHTTRAGRLDFNYDLGGDEKPNLLPEFPGTVMEPMTERFHRSFYAYWRTLMEGTP